jgi:predicted nucleic acid-binding Zn ribbon protein
MRHVRGGSERRDSTTAGIMAKAHRTVPSSTGNPHVKVKAPAAAVGDLVAQVVQSAGLGQDKKKAALLQAWRDAVGREIAAQTEIQGLRGGVLTVLVGSAALAHDLMVYYRRDLLARLREQCQTPITDLRCKVTGTQVGGADQAPRADERGRSR